MEVSSCCITIDFKLVIIHQNGIIELEMLACMKLWIGRNNSLEQCGRRSNLEIEGIPTSISDDELEKTAVGILNSIDVN